MARGGVFINYRSSDSDGYGALVYSELSRRLGPDLVFLDNESIPAGSDFVAHLLHRVRDASIVLAIIGDRWLTAADTNGRRRIDDPADWIRRELAEAFAAGATVVPLLVDVATMPTETQLPDDIAQLGRCQFRRLRQREARADIARLVSDLMTIDPRLASRTHPPTEPIVVGRTPVRADVFQDRPVLRAVLDHAGVSSGSAAVTMVITGDGGTGKTQLAVAAFHTALRETDIAMWITATTRASVLSAYSEAYAAINAITAVGGTGDAEQQAGRLLAWLAGTPRRWLIVLDDVNDPAELRGLWPSGPSGRVVVTTRRRDAALVARGQIALEVGTFTRSESLAYLTAKFSRATGVPTRVLDDAGGLAEDLGDLPLALSHAAATIINDGITCAYYRGLLADRARRLTDLLPADPADAGDEYAHGVSRTWSLARDRADRLDPAELAGTVLDVIGFLDPNGIPEAVLTSEPVRDHLAARSSANQIGQDHGGNVSVEQARRALRNLWRLSLVSHDPDDSERSVRVHALAQRAGIERLTPTTAATVVRVAADALMRVWPPIEAGTKLGLALRSNALVLMARHPTALWQPDAHPVLFRLGDSLTDSGLVTDAMSYLVDLAEHALGYLGSDHPDVLLARRKLAHARGDGGDPVGAVAAYRDLLEDQNRILGRDHPDTLATRGDLAWWRGMSGDPHSAAVAFEELAADRLRLLGPEHPDTLSTRNSWARWLGMTGELAVATAMFEQLLVDELCFLGPDHADTLTTRNNLAHVRGRAGDPAGAVTEIEQVLAGRLRVLGSDHPRTLATRSHLARWLGESGSPAAAADAFASVLADMLRVLGPDHRRTLSARSDLARWLGESGDPTGAVAVSEDVVADRRRVLGPDHVDTVVAERMLAAWRLQQDAGPGPARQEPGSDRSS